MPTEVEMVLAAIRGRRSIRAYEERPLDEETVTTIIDAGIHAPTAMGLQPWRFIVVRDRGLMKQISDYCKPVLRTMLEGATDETATVFRELLSRENFEIFYGAPVLVLVLGDRKNPYSTYDCTLCAGTMMLAAHAMGIGSCWIGAAGPVAGSHELMKMLEVPAGYEIIAPLIFGYPGEHPGMPARAEPRITWV
ncbi:nitroreductase family protein [Methanofollis formosanus]|uniref:Nitroreductase family protein n=1 Tax=Methanofollis formosanus TaxID=299308 RepID=A0A8G1A201_9EURY|nr:nitroreductase family protein [Methanofollis formosanus]QYZ79924.1 nitroreductase family protein [Methanofollis formosanus]